MQLNSPQLMYGYIVNTIQAVTQPSNNVIISRLYLVYYLGLQSSIFISDSERAFVSKLHLHNPIEYLYVIHGWEE